MLKWLLGQDDTQNPKEWKQMFQVKIREEMAPFDVRFITIALGVAETELLGHTTSDYIKNNYKEEKKENDGKKYQWRCRAKGCRLTRSIRDGTFSSASRLSIQQLLDLMFYWSQGLDSHKHLRRHCNLASEHPGVIDGAGHVVEIDESSWTKRKYNRGRVIPNQWVFGSIDRDTRECFAVAVNRRDAATLLPVIQHYVRPVTTIYNDEWGAYISLKTNVNGYEHDTVKHSLHFVDPQTAVHT
ncbi:unnamed protein product [Didymodactylos carnosus]|uniref:ISXO2-like transposase domain-containing protein n=1 Tax=Didymodactylos carnosus TaxID=1234261 RepID=A0A815C732_9BILA|nr:unnamed protein product [Didymodactylos carnosus]CAF1279462.1 unnamed protein product [Didymodactylos carnosus]CAF3773269.1 unnamed protein product [Didymodactylos carnosus]CAF4073605.1 unnamed protein product [Didymodactylos carnosus]